MVRFWVLGATDLQGDAAERDSLLAQPRRLALLAYLALAHPRGFVRRDVLLAMFWPESDDARARNALRQALHFLRRALGDGVIVARGDDEVGIDVERFWCDALAFQQEISANNGAEALGIYRGELLPGLHIADSTSAFENWLDDERMRLRRLAANAAWQASGDAEARGDVPEALRCGRRAVAESPGDELAVRKLLSLLDRWGDRAGAAKAYGDFERALAGEYDVRPSAETRALLEEIRARAGSSAAGRSARPQIDDGNATPAAQPDRGEVQPAARLAVASNRRRAVKLITALGVLGVAVAAWWGINRNRGAGDASSRILAVGDFRDDSRPDSLRDSRIVGDLLATNLARLPRIQVLSRERLREVLGQLGPNDATGSNLVTAARDAGATEMLEGILYHRPAGGFRLDIRAIEVRGGRVRNAYTAEASDLFALVDSATRRFAEEMGDTPTSLRIADVTTASLPAYRLYQEGIRAYAAGEVGGAERLFISALHEDSTFAMAAYYAALVNAPGDYAKASAYADRAARLAQHASERERLLILAARAHWLDQPTRLPLAAALVERYPLDPEAYYRLGDALIAAGHFLDAVAPLRRVISLDSLGLRGATPLCHACDAFSRLAYAYFMADSLSAAERVVREWVRAQPRNHVAWAELARYFADAGRFAEARNALRTQSMLYTAEYAAVDEARLLLREEHYSEADRILRAIVRTDAGFKGTVALWYLAISLRSQGRFKEALRDAREYRQIAFGDERKLDSGGLLEAQILLEQGRPAEAATLFGALGASVRDPYSAARAARHIAWRLTLESCALAAAGDTARLPRLADSVQQFANVSGYGRDQVLRHHVLGLLLAERGQDTAAAEEFRRALYSPNGGFTRTNIELARTLLRLRRPSEAVAVLQPAFRVETDAMALYATRTELHQMLAKAFEAAGVRDSAAVHYTAVQTAWRNADAGVASAARAPK